MAIRKISAWWSASPLLGITFGTPDERVLPEDAMSRQVSSLPQADFDGNDDAALHVVDTPVGKAPLESYAAELSGLQGVVRVETSTGTRPPPQALHDRFGLSESGPAPAVASEPVTESPYVKNKSPSGRGLEHG
jgi:RND superfamily putative drug exporter